MEPYQEATSQIDARMARLDSLTKNTGPQQQRMYQLRRIEKEELAVLQQIVQLDKEGRDLEAGQIVMSGVGKRRMDELRHIVAEMEKEEDRLLALRATLANRDRRSPGVGGSGGAKAGRVKSVWLENVGHLVPMEAVGQTADAALDWLDSEMQRWTKEEDEFRKMWSAKPIQEKRMIDDKWKEMMGPLPGKKLVAPKM